MAYHISLAMSGLCKYIRDSCAQALSFSSMRGSHASRQRIFTFSIYAATFLGGLLITKGAYDFGEAVQRSGLSQLGEVVRYTIPALYAVAMIPVGVIAITAFRERQEPLEERLGKF